jgi:hypothetical protein
MTGISASIADAAPLSPLTEPPAAEGHGSAVDNEDDNDDTTSPPLLDLLERFPDLFAQKVLQHLDPIDRTFLAQVGSACRAAVVASDLPRAGTRAELMGKSVWVVTHRVREFVGSIKRLAWAKASGCPWVAETCMLVAEGGRLEVLQWARAHGCSWGVSTTAYAARGGHLEMLKWARQHGCDWDVSTCHLAETVQVCFLRLYYVGLCACVQLH